ncbi:guanosine polyphosphate pyrophosphohydrolase [Rickettsia amblyommatis]|uniref:Guanosine polyphosphate pyrophosphohydrolase/synthetase n=1 Tax=Rickettsia amblyommatis (strain GAT-30V) TaxID=1105111 RepID=H8K685_RICAG|nr:guanosine polyphosphate pyrophosphohydrolase [Rickettsia amblyommatis]AFC70396.1 guanosine polyphosphate pyrophosphohydrolase/synthetase [Rickettsia amblyommatis str. GAT-30V]
MTYQHIIAILQRYDHHFDCTQFDKAIKFLVKYCHNNKYSLEISETLISTYPDTKSVITSLLFFSSVKNHLTLTHIKYHFGEEIATIFFSLVELFRIQNTYCNTIQETFQLFCSLKPNIAIRVLLIRFAYLLHKIIFHCNISDIEYYLMSEEIKDIYVPLFKEITVEKINNVLQNVCLEILQPKLYKFITDFLKVNYQNPDQLVIKVINSFHDILSRLDVEYAISGRVKSTYSIAHKLVNKSNEIKNLCDIIGIRVIVAQDNECYKVLNTIFNYYAHIPKRNKDFIKCPKKNNYQSLHTVIIDKDLRKLEVQIRTRRMHNIAQSGSASHLQYKLNLQNSNNLDIAHNILNKFILNTLNQYSSIPTIVPKYLRINRLDGLISYIIGPIKPNDRTLKQGVSIYHENTRYYVDTAKIVNVNQQTLILVSKGKPYIATDTGKTSQLQGVSLQNMWTDQNSIKNSLSMLNKRVSYNTQIKERHLEQQLYTEKNLSSNGELSTNQLQEIEIANTSNKNPNLNDHHAYLKYYIKCTNTHTTSSMQMKSDYELNYINKNVLIDAVIQNDQNTDNLSRTFSKKLKLQCVPECKKKDKLFCTEVNLHLQNDSDNTNCSSDVSSSQKRSSQQKKCINTATIKFISDDDIMNIRIEELMIILKDTQITYLDLSNNNIGDKEIKILTPMLKDTQITYLDLSNNNIGDKEIKILTPMLKDTQITYLDLSNNNIGDKEIKILTPMLKDTQITYLNLRQNYIGDIGVRELAKILNNMHITYLNLSSNAINDTGTVELAAILKDTQITHLDLSSNNVGDTTIDDAVGQLAAILPDTKITHLNLGYNCIDAAGIIALAKILPDTKITHLSLEFNNVDNAGATALAKILKDTKITYLNLDCNVIGLGGIRTLTTIVKEMNIIIHLTGQQPYHETDYYDGHFSKLQRIEFLQLDPDLVREMANSTSDNTAENEENDSGCEVWDTESDDISDTDSNSTITMNNGNIYGGNGTMTIRISHSIDTIKSRIYGINKTPDIEVIHNAQVIIEDIDCMGAL